MDVNRGDDAAPQPAVMGLDRRALRWSPGIKRGARDLTRSATRRPTPAATSTARMPPTSSHDLEITAGAAAIIGQLAWGHDLQTAEVERQGIDW